MKSTNTYVLSLDPHHNDQPVTVARYEKVNSHVATLTDVGKKYPMGEVQVRALENIDLCIYRGRFNFVVGPSGSGKTTLLNLLGCIDKSDSGNIHLLDHDIATLNDNALSDFRSNHIGYIFQHFNLIPVLSAYENIEYPLLLTGMAPAKRKQRVTEVLAAVGLDGLTQHRPNQLSGGQRQRVAIARALVKAPALVLADEPTANLDTQTSLEVIELMKHMQRQYDTTFVFSTHDVELMPFADVIIRLRDGRLENVETKGARQQQRGHQ
ncbi:MAG: ABC transporter ATP-binding protein [Gammaproteobacteria bacterium]|nr:ABC transporter ATP-binding protein [Gammaproteobacteria bacterium]